MSPKYWIAFATIIALPPLVGLTLWLWLLAAPDPLHHSLATLVPWPVACSSRGCVTTTAWNRHTTTRVTFAHTTHQDTPTSAQTLETLIRQHLTKHAVIRSPVTPADARRYREEILNSRDEAAVKAATGLTLANYDEHVLLPFLQQEALRQQRKVESTPELYAGLAQDRFIVVLPLALGWDRSRATVTTTSLYAPRQN